MASRLIKHQLINVIKRFKFEELESSVIPIFPEISWSHVKSKLIKNHKRFTVKNAVCVIEEILNNADLGERILHDRLITLEVTDISRHDKRKIWYGYELKGVGGALNYLERRQIQESIKEAFESNGLNIDVKAAIYDNITFINIKEKSKRRRVQRTMPIFFALFMGHKYFFCSKKNISHGFINLMATALGYNKSKRIKLMGKDLRSLIRLLWNKQQGTLHAEDIHQPSVYEPSDPIINNDGIDYTQNKQRKSYAEKCFSKDPPTLELLVVNGPEESIKHEAVASILPNDNIQINWEFRSHNIARFLTSLIEKRAVRLPLPEYVSNLMTFGKNELTLQPG
ncbi:uncharacterized protein LOC115238987 isoform X2 [Formica exsecta]|uniref:uncharacterized protein LOC115238987 isoform X2 n=1 Tax=Formica exsecta TaxID=72781 RepID=UPI001142105F|nr:uncharacterized protein LOC115238987 isoform X2 [Formica exsecta]